uniref:(northern house mosquito) hypothetical protein n=1 Tax=Culex pipiens TaxID=7175 RepID=A0A8D8CA59_CULPI
MRERFPISQSRDVRLMYLKSPPLHLIIFGSSTRQQNAARSVPKIHSFAGRRREHIRSRWPGGPVADGLEVREQMAWRQGPAKTCQSRESIIGTGHHLDWSGRRPRGCSDGGTFAGP